MVDMKRVLSTLVGVVFATACAGADEAPSRPTVPAQDVEDVIPVEGNRGLYVRCRGTGLPTIVMEAGDGDDSSSYDFAQETLAKETRTCVYDRANLGRSDPARGPRRFGDLVGDLETLLDVAGIPGPYVLVGTSGGGFITAGYAVEHPDRVAGMVLIDTGAPLEDPPREIVEATAPDHPENVEKRDYLQVERTAWAAREEIGDFPMTVVTVDFSAAAERESPFPAERRAMKDNVRRQKGWLVLSRLAEQKVVRIGHAVEEERPDLVIDVILEVLDAAR